LTTLKKDAANTTPGGKTTPFDRVSHQKKVRQWFQQPVRFCKEIEKEQLKYPDMCIFHLSKSHATADCYVRKKGDNQPASSDQSTSASTSGGASRGQLRHITEENFSDAVENESNDACLESLDNDTNDVDLLYFARVSNHYLRLVRSSPATSTLERHSMNFPVIADSGANFHMFKDRDFFTTLSSAMGHVILGDGKTSLNIMGVGTVECIVDNHLLVLENVRYVPDLSESVYSLFQHIQQPGHCVRSSFEEGLFVVFPTFACKARIGLHDIYLDFIPACHKSVSLPDTIPDAPSNTTLSPSIPFHRSIQQFQEELHSNTEYLDTLLQKLRDYYELVKTKRQLDFEVPAGFQKFTQHYNLHQQNLIHQPQQQPDGATDGGSDDFLHHHTSVSPLPPALPESPLLDTADMSNTVTNTSPSEGSPPIVRSVDKPSSSLPCTITMSEDFLHASMGFRRVDTIKKHLTDLYCATIKLDSSPADAVLDAGDLATMRKTPRNTSAVPRPSHFGDVVHMDIVFGPEVSIGNIHYGLIFSDRHSRMTYIYPLQNLTSDIPKQMQAFFAHLGMLPKRLISDFDLKLIGGSARNYLNSMLIHVNAAPSHRQDRNGLVERHWQTMVSMARNWLASSELWEACCGGVQLFSSSSRRWIIYYPL